MLRSSSFETRHVFARAVEDEGFGILHFGEKLKTRKR